MGTVCYYISDNIWSAIKPKLIKTVKAMTFRLNSRVMFRLIRMTQ